MNENYLSNKERYRAAWEFLKKPHNANDDSINDYIKLQDKVIRIASGFNNKTNILSIEVIIRRSITIILSIILIFSPITLFEIIIYFIRWVFFGKKFPGNPFCFNFFKRMWN